MTIQQAQLQSNIWHVTVHGRLDQMQTPQLEAHLDALLQDDNVWLIIDLSDTSYINSGGLRCLVSGWRKARQQEGNLVLCGLNTRLQEIFAMIGFDKVFKIYPNCDQASQDISA